MKKTILTIMVAAMMLVAFTACEQQMPTYKVPTGLTISTTKTAYIVGEVVDTSTFSGVVRYSDGSSDNLTGAELSLNLKKIAKDGNLITATYGAADASGKGNVVEATTVVYGYEVTKAVLGNLPTSVVQSAEEDERTAQELPTDGVTVTVTYGGNTRELTAGEYSLKLTAPTTAVTPETGTGSDGVDITAKLYVFGSGSSVQNVTTGKVIVEEYKDEPYELTEDVTAIKVIPLKDMPEKFYYGQNVTEFTNNIEVRVTDKAETSSVKWDDSDSVVIATGYTIAWGAGVTNNAFSTAGTDLTTAAKVAYTVSYGNTGIRTASATVGVYNYVESISVGESKIDGATKGAATSEKATAVTVTGTLAFDSNTADQNPATVSNLSGWYFVNPYFSGAPTETIRYINAIGTPCTTTVPVTYAAN